jgi:hypothetical protein
MPYLTAYPSYPSYIEPPPIPQSPQAGSGGLLPTPGSGGVMMPSFEFGEQPAQQPAQAQQELTPQQLVQQRAALEAKDRQARQSMQKWFGSSGSPIASAGGNVFGAIAANQLGGFLNYGNALDQAYNSASGPYGQLQQAAVLTAPSRAERAVASITSQAQERMNAQNNATKAQIARAIAGAISGGGRGELSESASDFQRYSPLYDPRLRRPRPQGVFAGVQ